jgi:hypothetical protein
MDDSLATIIKTGACEIRIRRTGERYVKDLGGVQFSLKTGAAEVKEWLDVGEAEAVIAAFQLVVDGVQPVEEPGVLAASDDLVAACERFDAGSAGVSHDG